MSKVFGGSKSQSTSSNRAYGQLSSTFSPVAGQTANANNLVMQLLGGDNSGLEAYKTAVNSDFELDRGLGAINSSSAGRGVLRSGARDKAAAEFQTNLGNRYADNYIQKLLGVGQQGLQAGGIIAGAGQVGESSSKSKPGIGKFLGQVVAGAAMSDRRSKKDIVRIGTYGDIGLYLFNYLKDSDNMPLRIGVMAQEVEEFYPEALGPYTYDGYMTVDYDVLKESIEQKEVT